MKEFFKVIIIAVVLTAALMTTACFTANILKPFDRELVECIAVSIVGLSMLAPLCIMGLDIKSEKAFDISIWAAAIVPIFTILVAAMLLTYPTRKDIKGLAFVLFLTSQRRRQNSYRSWPLAH